MTDKLYKFELANCTLKVRQRRTETLHRKQMIRYEIKSFARPCNKPYYNFVFDEGGRN